MNNTFTLDECSCIMKQILEAIHHLNIQNIIHRDIKPENLVFANKNNLNSLKLIDFGLATENGTNIDSFLYEKCGTFIYMPPEQLECKEYSNVYFIKKTDIWACGIITYILFTFCHPFYKNGDSQKDLLVNINKPFIFPDNIPKYLL